MSLNEPYTWRQIAKFASIICLLLVAIYLPVYISWRIYQYRAVQELVQAVEERNSAAVVAALEQVKSRDATAMARSPLLELMESNKKAAFSSAMSQAVNGMGPEVVSNLLEKSKASESSDIRCRAIHLLAGLKLARLNQFEIEHITSVLMDALRDKKQFVRLSAAQAMAHFDLSRADEVLPLIVGLLKDPSAYIRLDTVYIIGLYGRRAEIVLPDLLRVLEDPVSRIRILAARAVIKVGVFDQRVIEAFIQMLSDENYSCQSGAASSLGQLGPEAKNAIPALLERLTSLRSAGPNEINDWDLQLQRDLVRISVIEALGEIGHASPAVIQELINELNDQKSDYSRECAAIALGKLGPDAHQAVPHLLKVVQEQEVQTQVSPGADEEMAISGNLGLEAEIALESIDPIKFNRILKEPGQQ
jgi:HEAT repeat protein